ncbi:hypothetical protein [Nocardia jinanensis]|uniref:Uncharacterized protein n=1 Tax=Nocardia jinanensis TaxID=382504 RepID=A0A917RG14_9NOCA|nr:hypothetical protein [Nocardia jinanensis]GGL06043.1 hypothetical protein GCM10011588_20670 [Nocardia jinanensis]
MSTATLSAPTTSDALLRRTLRLDGWGTGAFGVLMLAGAVPLRDPLGVPTSWSVPFGVAMLGGALVLLLIAGYPVISPRHAAGVVAFNSVSALGLLALPFIGLLDLTGPGIVFFLSGALVVAAFAALEYTGLRRITG